MSKGGGGGGGEGEFPEQPISSPPPPCSTGLVLPHETCACILRICLQSLLSVPWGVLLPPGRGVSATHLPASLDRRGRAGQREGWGLQLCSRRRKFAVTCNGLGCLVEVLGPAVVSQPTPALVHLLKRGGCQGFDRGEPLHPTVPVGNDGGNPKPGWGGAGGSLPNSKKQTSSARDLGVHRGPN